MKLIHVFSVFSTAESFFDGQFAYLSQQGYEMIVVSSPSERAAAFAQRNGVRFVPIEIPRQVSPGAIGRAIGRLCRLIRREQPDAVFGHTPVGALCAMVAARICGVPRRVYYRHGLIYTTMRGMRHFVFQNEERVVAALATDVVNVSHSLSKLAVAEHLNADAKQHVIGHGTCGGIDARDIFNPERLDAHVLSQLRRRLGLEGVELVFGYCGRICNDKGIPELVDAFEQFQSKHPQMSVRLLLIGQYDTRDGVSQACRSQMQRNSSIIVTGHVDKADIASYYALLDVFVFPSHREGFGMCVVEASAMERPVLVSRAHGCIDSIVEHETGEYIGLTAQDICRGMELMLDASLRRRLGQAGRQRVLAWYDQRVMWPLVGQLYRQILRP